MSGVRGLSARGAAERRPAARRAARARRRLWLRCSACGARQAEHAAGAPGVYPLPETSSACSSLR